jgi:sigma-70-like protein
MNSTPTGAALERLLDERGPQLMRVASSQASVQASHGAEVVDLRDALVRLLRQLPPRQRAVIVLRYWEQRTEAETAALLGCSEGTVKSAASRGLRQLRDMAGTYLPVRLSATFLTGPNRGHQLVTDFWFLPPTKANLAMLHAAIRRAPIPATFRLLPAKYLILAGA